ncbi:bifunctional pyr operon transcriptional regulator/uracil phosphoribosyltransferase [Gammaproteobacteria bacterium 45_16_T64]|nr:bifunctional pyr operon transcriptional regulator/uracil phosphoribosyltransferase [Gammaproteobacteria bacterium 45_16_T64]
MPTPDVGSLITQMSQKLQQFLAAKQIANPAMIGIHTGGAWIAKELHHALSLSQPLGLLDITFYRDDFTEKGLHPAVKASDLPFSTDGQHIILIDDVMSSGRTIRAALNEIFDYGRPASVILATLVDVPCRHLPIQPDVIGERLDLTPQQRVKLRGPDNLRLEIIQVD